MPVLDRDGVRINYEVTGASSEHVTLIHGMGANYHSWDYTTERLKSNYTILRYDTRGHGLSDKPPGPYRLDDFVEDLRTLLDHCGVEKTSIVGFSFGGMIAQAMAVKYQERVDKLAIISAVAGRTPEEKATLAKRADELDVGGASSTVESALERWFTPEFREANPEIIEKQRQRILTNDPTSYAAAYRVFAECDVVDELHKIKHPTLIATGENDPGSSPRMARLMHDRISDSEIHIFPHLRHSLLTEAPDKVTDLVFDFFQRRS